MCSSRCLKPGGYLEEVEYTPGFKSDDGTVNPSTAMGQWGGIVEDASARTGRTSQNVYLMADMGQESGL